MADVHSKQMRSYNMSCIKTKNTKPEMLVRRFLHANGFRYRLHAPELPGKPDIVLPKYNTIIFVHGCFWHGHESCRYFMVPQTRTEWWLKKINGNKANDKKKTKLLKDAGWRVIQIYECELKKTTIQNTFNKLLKKIHR